LPDQKGESLWCKAKNIRWIHQRRNSTSYWDFGELDIRSEMSSARFSSIRRRLVSNWTGTSARFRTGLNRRSQTDPQWPRGVGLSTDARWQPAGTWRMEPGGPPSEGLARTHYRARESRSAVSERDGSRSWRQANSGGGSGRQSDRVVRAYLTVGSGAPFGESRVKPCPAVPPNNRWERTVHCAAGR